MSEYKMLSNFLLFKEMNSDSIGVNFRAGMIENRKAAGHVLLAEAYPFISNNPEIWKRVSILMEGIHKSNIPNLYSPRKVIKEENRALLVYPYMNTWTFEEILDESAKRDIPINFDLTFSIALAIADLIDTGSSIVVSGEKSFHGFLTPDNILVDQDGKIYLKNYGIFPYLGKQEELFREIVNKYGAWVAPEFLRKERLLPQSDIYHLGYLIFRILTGEYFSCSENENFDAKFANISFTQHLPSSDKEFITHLINFFKRTLHPEPAKRFANIKEFKDYISHFFHIEELSSVTFNLAYFMNSLYLEVVEEEAKVLEQELAYVIPERKPEPQPMRQAAPGPHSADEIMAGLEDKPKSPLKILIPVILVAIVAIAVFAYFYISGKAGEIEKQLTRVKQEQALAQQEYQSKLKALETTKAANQAEEAAKADQIAKLKQEWDEQQKKQQEQIKAIQDQTKLKEKELEIKEKEIEEKKKKDQAELEQKQKDETDRIQKETEQKRLDEERKKLEEEQNRVTPGQEVAISEVSEQPVKLKGKDPQFPVLVKRKYANSKPILIRANMRIDENGVVTHVNIIGTYPEDITSVIIKSLKKWEYKPAVKNNVKVTVWLPVQLNINLN